MAELVSTRVIGLLAPIITNLGPFNFTFQYKNVRWENWSWKVQDLSYLGTFCSNLSPNLTSLYISLLRPSRVFFFFYFLYDESIQKRSGRTSFTWCVFLQSSICNPKSDYFDKNTRTEIWLHNQSGNCVKIQFGMGLKNLEDTFQGHSTDFSTKIIHFCV